MLAKRRKICYNTPMSNPNQGQSNDVSSPLLGERTPAKLSGLSYTVLALVFFALSVVFTLCFGANTEGQAALYGAFLLAPVAFALTAQWYFALTKTSVKSFFKAQNCAPKYYAIALLLQVGVLSFGELNTLFLKFLERFGYQGGTIVLPNMQGVGFFGVLIAVAILPALFEELFFRGFFLQGTKGLPTWGRVLLCGALFALYHQNPVQTFYQGVCGVAFALVAVRANSFLPSALAHFINNALVLILQKCGVESYPLPLYIAMLAASVLCLAVSLTLLCRERTERGKEKAKLSHFFVGAAVGILVFGLSWITALVEGF